MPAVGIAVLGIAVGIRIAVCVRVADVHVRIGVHVGGVVPRHEQLQSDRAEAHDQRG